MRSILSRDIMLLNYEVNIITWHYVVSLWGQYYHVTLCCSTYEVNIITWHYVVHTMRSILSRDIMLFTLWQHYHDIMLFHMRSILSRDIMLFTLWQYYHVTLCCSPMRWILSRDINSHYEVNIITWHYVVHIWGNYHVTLCCSPMRSILSRDIMLFTLWGQYYHVTLCCFHYEVNIITWHYVFTMRSILSRDIMLFTIWGKYYHVTLCCSHYEQYYHVTLCCFIWGQYYHVTLCCSPMR